MSGERSMARLAGYAGMFARLLLIDLVLVAHGTRIVTRKGDRARGDLAHGLGPVVPVFSEMRRNDEMSNDQESQRASNE